MFTHEISDYFSRRLKILNGPAIPLVTYHRSHWPLSLNVTAPTEAYRYGRQPGLKGLENSGYFKIYYRFQTG